MCYLLWFRIIQSNHFAITIQFLTCSGHEYDHHKEKLFSNREPQYCFICICSQLLMGCDWDLIQSDHQIIHSLLLFFMSFKIGLHSSYAKSEKNI